MVTRPNISALRQSSNFISEGNVIRSTPVRFTRLRQGNNPEQVGSFSNLTYRVQSDGTIIQERRGIRLLRSGSNTLQQTADIKEIIKFNPDGSGTREVYEFVPSRSGRSESRKLLEREVLSGDKAVLVELRTNLTSTQKQNLRFRQAKREAQKSGQSLTRNQFNRQTKDINTTTQKQRVAAIRKVGVIRQVTRGKDEVTFVGATGRKITFPKGGLKFTGREKPGGIATREAPISVAGFQARLTVRVNKLVDKIEKKQGELTPTKRREFAERLFKQQLKKQGFTNIKIDKAGNIIGTNKNGRRKIITSDFFRSVVVPKGAKVDISRIRTKAQEKRAEEREQKKFKRQIQNSIALGRKVLNDAKLQISKGLEAAFGKSKNPKEKGRAAVRIISQAFLGFGDFAVDIGKGLGNIIQTVPMGTETAVRLFGVVRDGVVVGKELEILKKKKNPTQKELKRVEKAVNNFKKRKSGLQKTGKLVSKANALLNKQESKLARDVVLLGSVAVGAGAIGGTLAAIAKVTLVGVAAVATGVQGLETLKKPTARNFGRLAFFALPTAIGILKGLRKLAPSFRPSVKNVGTTKAQLNTQLTKNNGFIRQIRSGKTVFVKGKKVPAKKALALLKKDNATIRQGLRELGWILRNKDILKTRDFNPLVHTKALAKLQGSYRTGLHVSTQPKVGKLFGQKIERVTTLKKLLTKVGAKEVGAGVKVSEIKAPGKGVFKQINSAILNQAKKRQLPLTGSFAQNLFVGKKFRRVAGDIDLKAVNPRSSAMAITLFLRRKFPNINFKVRTIAKATRITANGRTVLDIAKLNKGVKTVRFQGFRVVGKAELFRGKLEGVVLRRKRVGKKDIKDIIRLSEGKVRAKDVLIKTRNNSNVFEVVRQPTGMGKSRLGFDETHLYFDFEAAVAYSQGNKYSIIKFPVAKISKFPKRLRIKINKAARGQLSTNQGIALRKSLNAFIKTHPNQFFISPRSGSLPIGEREWVLATSSRLIKGQLYKTFDRDTRSFVSIIEMGFKKPLRLSLARRFINGWKKKPFTTLRLRLTNPDIQQVRKFRRVLERDLGFTARNRKTFLGFLAKIFKGKKAQAKLPTLKRRKALKEGAIKAKKAAKKKRISPSKKRKVAKRISKRIIRKRIAKVKPRVPVRKLKRKPTRKVVRKPTRKPIRKPTRVPVRKAPRKVVRKPTRKPVRKPVRERKRVPGRVIVRKPIRTPTRVRVRVPVRKPVRRKPPIKIPTKDRIVKFNKVITRKIKTRKFIFIPDLISILFGDVAGKKEAKALLKKGRIFTGQEARRLVRVK